MNHVSLESDNNSDIVFDETKMVPAGKDFKIVFISSESKSGSELNSSLECELNPEHEETLNNVKGTFVKLITKSLKGPCSSIEKYFLFMSENY